LPAESPPAEGAVSTDAAAQVDPRPEEAEQAEAEPAQPLAPSAVALALTQTRTQLPESARAATPTPQRPTGRPGVRTRKIETLPAAAPAKREPKSLQDPADPKRGAAPVPVAGNATVSAQAVELAGASEPKRTSAERKVVALPKAAGDQPAVETPATALAEDTDQTQSGSPVPKTPASIAPAGPEQPKTAPPTAPRDAADAATAVPAAEAVSRRDPPTRRPREAPSAPAATATAPPEVTAALSDKDAAAPHVASPAASDPPTGPPSGTAEATASSAPDLASASEHGKAAGDTSVRPESAGGQVERPATADPSRIADASGGTGRHAEIDRVRFVQRVARAFHQLGESGGELRLRLSPPELGALRLEVAVREGVLTARLEAETPAARALLFDNLPALRERLAAQDVRVERFEVDLWDRSKSDRREHPDFGAPPEGRERGRARASVRTKRTTAVQAIEASVGLRASESDRLNVVI
jgi:flagellar hook-length control protein FliK